MSIERFKNPTLEWCRITMRIDIETTRHAQSVGGVLSAPDSDTLPARWGNACDVVSDELSRAMWAVVS